MCNSTICAKPVLAAVLLKVTYPTSALPSLPYKPIIWISSPQVWSQLLLKMNVFATHSFPEKSWASGLLLVKNLKEQVAAICLQFLSWNEIEQLDCFTKYDKHFINVSVSFSLIELFTYSSRWFLAHFYKLRYFDVRFEDNTINAMISFLQQRFSNTNGRYTYFSTSSLCAAWLSPEKNPQ